MGCGDDGVHALVGLVVDLAGAVESLGGLVEASWGAGMVVVSIVDSAEGLDGDVVCAEVLGLGLGAWDEGSVCRRGLMGSLEGGYSVVRLVYRRGGAAVERGRGSVLHSKKSLDREVVVRVARACHDWKVLWEG